MSKQPVWSGLVRSAFKIMGCGVIATLMVCLGPSLALASDVTYEYTGAPFGTCIGFSSPTCSQFSITGSMTLANPLTASDNSTQYISPVTFSFTDNDPTHPIFNNLNDGGLADFYVYSTDATGLPTSWAFFIATATQTCTSGFQISSAATVPFDCSGGAYGGWEGQSFAPGSWAITPEPPAALLFGSGLLALGFYLRRRLAS